jgi:signal transduction histidine kinase
MGATVVAPPVVEPERPVRRPTSPHKRRRLTHPVVLFVAAGAVTVTVLLFVLSWFSTRAAQDEATLDARNVTNVLAHSVTEPLMPRGLVAGRAASLDIFDRRVRHRLLVAQIVRIKLWSPSGRIIYSDKVQLIGKVFPLDAQERQIVLHGGTAADITDLSKPENRYERGHGKLLEVYTQVHGPAGQPLLFEAYFPYSGVIHRTSQIVSQFRPITIFGLLVFLLLTTPLVWVLARRLDRSAAERERLLLAAVEASDIERRRIARDLHDTVVQELAAVSFALSAAAREMHDQPAVSRRLDGFGGRVRNSLRSLRSLLVEIYPPELRKQGLGAALEDLLAPATGSGVETVLDVADISQVSLDRTALVWRVAQEAVRNALRHGRPSRLEVRVTTPDKHVKLVVSDDGAGFDTLQAPPYGHLGLRSLRDLVAEAGGTLDVTSVPGAGTTLTLTLSAT